MVYIFFVQSGTMMTFDNEISIMESVANLNEKIQERCQIPVQQQVLLINGGESLESQKNLCSYMAGTDTNPIYLFSTDYDTAKLDILKNLSYDDSELKKRLIESLSLPVSLTTVKLRALVAQDFFSVAKLQLEFCENMVLEQHLQQQGWSAVIANLEDIVTEFRKRWELFQKMYNDFIAERHTFEGFLLSFEEDKRILQRIPLIDVLFDSQKNLNVASKTSETTSSTSQTVPNTEISLFEWISSSSSSSSSTRRLEDLYALCRSSLHKFEVEMIPKLRKRIAETLSSAEKPERKEIEGLGKRLFDLDDLLRKMKKAVEHQSDMAQSFLQNQNSVAHMKDTSILPDLCATHAQQLDLVKNCHQRIIEDRSRIVKSKNELSKSLCARIAWVQTVEDKFWELDFLLVYFNGQVNRLRKHLELFQQIHLAPLIYMNAVVEVVRRRSFSQLFLMWASDLACQMMTIYNEELTRRKDFSSQFEGHFLNALFPGMEDMPPPFAIEAPPMFDAKLPQISEEDLERLRQALPDFSEHLTVPDMSHVINFFMGTATKVKEGDKVDDANAVEEKLIQAVSDVGLSSNLDKNLLQATGSETSLASAPGFPILKDDKGCESETDTEEYEKISENPLELAYPQTVSTGVGSSHILEKTDASTSTEERSQILPPKKPPRSFRVAQSFEADPLQRTPSISTNESFSNIKNISLDSIDELSSIKNFSSTTDSCFNSHYNQSAFCKDQASCLSSTNTSSLHLTDVTSLSINSKVNILSHYQGCSLMLSRSKSISPQSPRDISFQDTVSPQLIHQSDFSTDEFYIDESLPSSVGTGNSQGSEFVRQLDTANIVVAMLQDNLQISRSEYEKLKTTVQALNNIAKLSATNLRDDLNNLKTKFAEQSGELKKQYEELGTSWITLLSEFDRNEKEIVECMRRENEGDKEQYRYNILEKEDIVRRLEEDKRAMEDRIQEMYLNLASLEEKLRKQNSESANRINDLLKELREKDAEKEQCLKELSENLKMEHRAEIDNMKSRFKLITMERSPSLTSLEKEKSGDFSSLSGHTTLLVQMTENFELDKEKAVSEERQRWENVLDEKIKELQHKFDLEKQILSQDFAKRFSQDKEKQIDILREREKNLSLEIIKHKTTIQQLTEWQEERMVDPMLIEELDLLRLKNKELQNTLSQLKVQGSDVISTATTVSKGETLKSSIATESKTQVVSARVNIDTCKIGDVVLVLWDQDRGVFKILQESKWLYFLHQDCLAPLGLSVTSGKPNKCHCVGEVVDIEFCESCKDNNRFKVKKGSKFFVLKINPVAPPDDVLASQYLSPSAVNLFETKESATVDVNIIQPTSELTPKGVEEKSVEDTGIIENVEQAAVALEDPERNADETFWSTQYIPDDRDRLLHEFLEREKQYQLEISKYKTTIEQLVESQNSAKTESVDLESLKSDNEKLQEELVKVKSEKEALMSSSMALCEGKVNAMTSPLAMSPPLSDMSRSEVISNSSRLHRLNIDTCKVGDVVLLLWDQIHENFKVLQESRYTYFLHSDCMDKLGLNITEGKPNKMYCTGEVVDKEYCQTRKSENRYKVPKGAKFFRVKVKPVSAIHRDSKELSQSVYMAKHSSGMSTSHSVITTFDPVMEENQPLDRMPQLSSEDADKDLEGEVKSESETVSENMPEQEDMERKIIEKKLAEDSGIEEAVVAIEHSDR
ncbi:RB1-inducible coiled-coil protein 1 isoform X2 [Euwallacea fornicatus]